jgi:hypothetical protein
MNYLKIYKNLIESRQKTRDLEKGADYEIHHVSPRCLGGTDESSNLVKLTYREHYIAHWLLIKIYPNEPKIHYGFLCMLRDPHGYRKLTSRMVETIKKNYSEFQKWNWKINNPMYKPELKKFHSERMKLNNPNKGGTSNHTAYPVEVIFEDGTKQKFDFMLDAAHKLNVPYSSMKGARKQGTALKKYGFKKSIKIEG